MTAAFVSKPLLARALDVFAAWSHTVNQQRSRHVWSLLPVKLAGAVPGNQIVYSELDDKAFMDRFLALRDGEYPYFDPFIRDWLPAGYFHSNMATMRKNRFVAAWNAATWKDDLLSLADNYLDVMATKALSKAGKVQRIPAIACAVWFFKKPSREWPGDPDLVDGVPLDAGEMVNLFLAKFNLQADPGTEIIFDLAFDLYIPDYSDLLEKIP